MAAFQDEIVSDSGDRVHGKERKDHVAQEMRALQDTHISDQGAGADAGGQPEASPAWKGEAQAEQIKTHRRMAANKGAVPVAFTAGHERGREQGVAAEHFDAVWTGPAHVILQQGIDHQPGSEQVDQQQIGDLASSSMQPSQRRVQADDRQRREGAQQWHVNDIDEAVHHDREWFVAQVESLAGQEKMPAHRQVESRPANEDQTAQQEQQLPFVFEYEPHRP